MADVDRLKNYKIQAVIEPHGFSGTLVDKAEGQGVVPLGEWAGDIARVGLKRGDQITFTPQGLRSRFETFTPGIDVTRRTSTTTEALLLVQGVRTFLDLEPEESPLEYRLAEAEVALAKSLGELLRKNPQGSVRDKYMRQLAMVCGEGD